MRVIGVGDNVVDRYVHQGVGYPGGNALNFAVYARWLGAESAYLGVFGNDEAAMQVKAAAAAEGVSLKHCQTKAGENGYACVGLSNGERTFLYSNRGGIAGSEPMVLTPLDMSYIAGHELVCTSVNSCMLEHLPALGELGCPVAFDFSEQVAESTIAQFSPHIDYAVFSCANMGLGAIIRLVRHAHNCGAPAVLATRGRRGALFSDGEDFYLRPARIVQARDSLGAGDAYLTAFLLSYEAWRRSFGHNSSGAARLMAVQRAMASGERMAAAVCMIDGAFGHGQPFADEPQCSMIKQEDDHG